MILCHQSKTQKYPHHSHTTPMLWSDYLSAVSHTSTMQRILITGGNIYNFGHNPGSLDIALKHRMPLSKNQCTDVWLYILCLIENYTNGVMFNYIPGDYVRNQPFIHCSNQRSSDLQHSTLTTVLPRSTTESDAGGNWGVRCAVCLHISRRVRRKATISFVGLSVRPSTRVEQLGYHWTDFHEIQYLSI